MRVSRISGSRNYHCEGYLYDAFVNRSAQLDNLLLELLQERQEATVLHLFSSEQDRQYPIHIQPLLERLHAFNPELSILFTVSPIRHMADGAHGNQLSKATLLLAVDKIISTFNFQHSIHYFPAYEIVLDELRDYRFYGPDLTHPSTLAEDIVYERLQQATMPPATTQQAHNNSKQMRRLRHIPLR